MSVNLQHPYAGPFVNELVLPNPALGNADVLNIKTGFNRSMDGTFRTYIRTPETHRLIMTFRTLQENVTCGSLSYDEVTDVINFMKAVVGDDIKLTDWDGSIWQVKIITSPVQFIQQNRSFHEVTLEFEGDLIP